MTAATPDIWQETCLVGVIPQNSPTGAGTDSFISACAMTEDISSMEWGEKEMEGKPLLCGGRVVMTTPMTDESLTLKVYPVDVLMDTSDVAHGVAQWFHPQATEDVTQPALVDNSNYRRKFGIILLWSTLLPATAVTLPAAGEVAYRIQIINAYMTKYKPDYSDKNLSAEITFKWTPFDKNGTSNKREESTDGSAQLPAAITSATSF